jgi:hypothetical protein
MKAITIMVLGILASCTAPTTAPPTGVSEIRDRSNFRDEQQGAPRVNNAPIRPLQRMNVLHVYEVRPRKDRRGVDVASPPDKPENGLYLSVIV